MPKKVKEPKVKEPKVSKGTGDIPESSVLPAYNVDVQRATEKVNLDATVKLGGRKGAA